MTRDASTTRLPQVPGFQAAGLHCGIKPKTDKDLALIVSEVPATAAGVFTRNRVVSPSVVWSQRALKKNDRVRAVLVNSGNANACVGPRGMKHCQTLARLTAAELGIAPHEVLIASTGVIGVPLPIDTVTRGLPQLTQSLSSKAEAWKDAADAILTTDLVAKTAVLDFKLKQKNVVIGGLCKGSGMIHPDMATMLAFVHTDAAVSPEALRQALARANAVSFNSITVDGDTSTNDCAFVLANGQADNPPILPDTKEYDLFVEALIQVCRSLAVQIVRDGEGATKFVTVQVTGARTETHATQIAKTVASSSLVKTALFGEDPNWGRILAAVGYAGVPVNADRLSISVNGALLFKNGTPAQDAPETLRHKMQSQSLLIAIDLNNGDARAEVYTCDLSYDYIRINAEYTT